MGKRKGKEMERERGKNKWERTGSKITVPSFK
jgi:hypothetical protein